MDGLLERYLGEESRLEDCYVFFVLIVEIDSDRMIFNTRVDLYGLTFSKVLFLVNSLPRKTMVFFYPSICLAFQTLVW